MLFYQYVEQTQTPTGPAPLLRWAMAARTQSEAQRVSGLPEDRFGALWQPWEDPPEGIRCVLESRPGSIYTMSAGGSLSPEVICRIATTAVNSWMATQNLALTRPDYETLHDKICWAMRHASGVSAPM